MVQYSLSWDSYKSNICTGFSSLQQNGEFVDMTLAADGHFVKVHQSLVALSSPYLKSIITSTSCQHPIIFLYKISHKTLKQLLEYMYTGEVLVSADNLTEFVEAARSLCIKGLENLTDNDTLIANMETNKIAESLGQIELPLSANKIMIKNEYKSIKKNITPTRNLDSTTIIDNDEISLDDDTPDDTRGHYTDDENSKTITCSEQGTRDKSDSNQLSSKLQFSITIRGALQIILNRYIYNLSWKRNKGIRRWRCVDYRCRHRCTAMVTTNNNVVMSRPRILDLFYYLLLYTPFIVSYPVSKNFSHYLKHPAVKKFIEYLRIDTSQEQNLQLAVDFIRRQAGELGLPFTVFETAGGMPICIITLKGKEPNLPSIMLNTHMDVVPAIANEWTYPPFEARMDKEGNIYARGAQDTKDVAIQYFEAIKKLMQANVTLLRTIHMTFMPDEETGGNKGIKQFVDTDVFRNLNIGFALDEGYVSESENLLLPVYLDKRPWQIQFTVHGQGGHGSLLKDGTAIENACNMLKLILEYREEQKKIMKSRNKLDYGAYTGINVDIVKAGLRYNMIPTTVIVGIDMRLSVDSKITDIEKLIKSWMNAAGNQTEIFYNRRVERSDETAIDDSNLFWVAMKRILTNMGMDVVPIVFPATSDIMVLRNMGIPAFGFSAKTATIPRFHDNDEYLNVITFIKVWLVSFANSTLAVVQM
ncbi:hypothetical protein K1T71_008649 [Dendrolimus kikuchii]|uniref:Uncharacterized protein n=1 Tax=Dendrolimus kikuchii TaxID=765133 RepID=A0ACC1CVK2_9NEOP|nr:hypothetical protein K1T71_008649 [Dendrolimus kikuchii]